MKIKIWNFIIMIIFCTADMIDICNGYKPRSNLHMK